VLSPASIGAAMASAAIRLALLRASGMRALLDPAGID
jgi:hypothetical protein